MTLESGFSIVAVESTVENKVIEYSACGEIVLTAPLPKDKEEEVTAAIKMAVNEAKPGNISHRFRHNFASKLCEVRDLFIDGNFEF